MMAEPDIRAAHVREILGQASKNKKGKFTCPAPERTCNRKKEGIPKGSNT